MLSEIERDLLDGAPVAEVLRKLIVLGGRAGSNELRDWASQELRGYGEVPPDDLPSYRRIRGLIQIDGLTYGAQISHQSIGVHQLPPQVQGHLTDEVPFWQGIGEIQAMVAGGGDNGAVRITLPQERLIAQWMDNTSGNRHQKITAVYWSLNVNALEGLLDQVRTRLAELLGELRSVTPPTADAPTAAQAAQAVNIVVHGKGARVQVAQSDHSATAALPAADVISEEKGPFWTLGKRLWGGAIGVATIAATVIGWLQLT
ncbi:hypothetical protein C5C42_17225 [Rathayibacter sp. AY1F7]|nr:hypothetical protein C5C54_17425 [Rathayibacter sp. AY1F2]PPG99851.1 hypothetical protein C5C32_10395 [Rathayibacter sp. AY1G9]PPH40774.1 hypothetical protein C5C42_17225 [Rathayibacter sp. AY1F7]